MELGAVDCIGKPSIDHPNSFDDLPARVRAAAGARCSAPASGGRARSTNSRPTSPTAESSPSALRPAASRR